MDHGKLCNILVDELQLITLSEFEALDSRDPLKILEQLSVQQRYRFDYRILPKVSNFLASKLDRLAELRISIELNGRNETLLILDQIAEGGFGRVYLAARLGNILDTDCRFYAVKIAHSERERSSIVREIASLQRIDHKHIVKFVTADSNAGVLVVEYVDGLTLQEFVKRRQRLEVREALQLATQMGKALEYMHHEKIRHRDVTPKNILISSLSPNVLNCILIDVGLADRGTDEPRRGGTCYYYPPEVLNSSISIDDSADIYGLAASIYYSLLGVPPHFELCLSVAFKSTYAEFDRQRWATSFPPTNCRINIFREEVPYQFSDLLVQSLGNRKDKRPLASKWLAKVNRIEEQSKNVVFITMELTKLREMLVWQYRETLRDPNLDSKSSASSLLQLVKDFLPQLHVMSHVAKWASAFSRIVDSQLLIIKSTALIDSLNSLIRRLKTVGKANSDEVANLVFLQCLRELQLLAIDCAVLENSWRNIARGLGYTFK